jgi:hypothetical protein
MFVKSPAFAQSAEDVVDRIVLDQGASGKSTAEIDGEDRCTAEKTTGSIRELGTLLDGTFMYRQNNGRVVILEDGKPVQASGIDPQLLKSAQAFLKTSADLCTQLHNRGQDGGAIIESNVRPRLPRLDMAPDELNNI